MKAIHIWIAVMMILCAIAIVLLVVMSSCSEKATDSVTETDSGLPVWSWIETEAAETGSETGSDETVTERATETATEHTTERATERATERGTEKETTRPVDPPVRNQLRFSSNPDGTCTLVGVGDCKDACISIPEMVNGQKVTAIAASAFYGCTTVTAIQIPATVRSIGDLAFAGCPNLTYLSVSAGNPSYQDMDGVLYSLDGTVLILYPPAHAGDTVLIGEQVKRVSAMAFYGCRYLKYASYAGTAVQWEQIIIGSGNHSLLMAAVTTQPCTKS